MNLRGWVRNLNNRDPSLILVDSKDSPLLDAPRRDFLTARARCNYAKFMHTTALYVTTAEDSPKQNSRKVNSSSERAAEGVL